MIAYTGLLLTETMATLLLALATATTISATSRRSPSWYALVGFLLGLAALCRAEFAILAGAVACTIPLLQPGALLRRLLASGLLGAVFVLTLAPWTVRNYLELRTFVPLTTDGWRTLWLATYPGGWLEWREEEPLLSLEAGAKGPVDLSKRFRAAALENLRTEPRAYVRLAVRSVVLLWVGGHGNVIVGLERPTAESQGIKYHPQSGWYDEGPSKGPPPWRRGLKPPKGKILLA